MNPSSRQLASCSILVLATAFGGVAGAQTAVPVAPTTDNRTEAKAHFDRGLALANQNQWEAALTEFLESRRLFPGRSATRNAAIAERQLGRYADALDLYDTLVTEFSASTPADQVQLFRNERTALLDRVGELTVVSVEPATRISVDGRQRAVAPLSAPIRLDAGVHTVRLIKDGFQALERLVTIPAGGKQSIEGKLQPLTGAGTLDVSEASGEPLEVVVDSTFVGRAPWRGDVSAGLHSVFLRGDHRGTAPAAVDVVETHTATLVLRAVPLDASALVEPSAPGSAIFVDGVFVGNGVWSADLPDGKHRFEVVAPDYLPFRTDAMLAPGARTTIRASLVKDRPRRDEVPKPTRFYVDIDLGLALSPSFRGGADAGCNCDPRARPFGLIAAGRFGYSPIRHLGVELAGGYLTLGESMTRSMVAIGDPGTSAFRANDYHDTTDLSGPFGAIGAAARFLERVPVTARVGFGLAVLTARTSNEGTFTGTVPGTSGEQTQVTGPLSVNEPSQSVLTPFVSTGVRIGYRFGARLSADIGLSLSLMFPAEAHRSERIGTLKSSEAALARAGAFTLPDETVAGAFLMWSPSAGFRVDL